MSVPDDICLIRLESSNANAIDEKLLLELDRHLDLALDKDSSAIVLTGYDKFFSAGLNLKELPEDKGAMMAFVQSFGKTYRRLLEFPRPVVAAVNGHAIAGGCVLACTADVRIAADGDYKLGVSEVSLGIVFPATAFEIMRHTVEPSWTTEVLLAGRLLTPAEAKKAGILHEVVPPDRLLETAMAEAARLGRQPRLAFEHSKLELRAPLRERIERTSVECRRLFIESWFSKDAVRKRKALLEK